MSKYNTKKAPTVAKTVTHQGGVGYTQEPKLELVGLLATGIGNTFYEKETEREKRLAELIAQVSKKDVKFVAQALVYTRSVIGQRSVTHRGAVELAKFLTGDELGKRFFSKRDRKAETGGVVYRIDDMLEIAACYMARNVGKPFSNAIKKGFKAALEAADEYELAKYQAKNSEISLIDIVNLVHPKPSEKMKPVFEKLMKGELKQFNTVEDKNTTAGQEIATKIKEGKLTKAQAEVALQEAKEDNYASLIREKKIGYLALLRNIRNILKNTKDTSLINDACALLTEPSFVKRSLVFPHQIDLALEIILDEFGTAANAFIKALNTAYELAIPNMSELGMHGRTAVVFDTSGSMFTPIMLSSNKRGSEAAVTKAALIAATLAKGIGADVYHFANDCREIKFNVNDSINTLKKLFLSKQGEAGGGTSFNCIMPKVGTKYDRVFVISDMQSGYGELDKTNAHVYSINIAGYGTTSIKPGHKVYQLFGYSADIYELVKRVEIDPKALIKAIEAIVI